MLEFVSGYNRSVLFAYPERSLSAAQQQQLNALLARRCEGEPIAYITGTREFWSLPLSVVPGVLVPRPDTEILVEKALALEPSAPDGLIIELGTGSGAIALAMAQELPHRTIIAVEKHTEALLVAAANISRFGHGRVCLLQANWLDALTDNCAAMILANPPYLAANDAHLPSLQHEPITALVSGHTGLEDLETIVDTSQRVAKEGCVLLLEHGFDQAESVRSLFTAYNYQNVDTERDLAGHERVSYGYANTGIL